MKKRYISVLSSIVMKSFMITNGALVFFYQNENIIDTG